MHAVNPTMSGRLPGTALGTFGFATEIALAAAAVIAGGVAEKCPDLRLAYSHRAGGFPLMLTRAEYFWGRRWKRNRPMTSAPAGANSRLPRITPAASITTRWFSTAGPCGSSST